MVNAILLKEETEVVSSEFNVVNNGLYPFPHSDRWIAELAFLSWKALNRLSRINSEPDIAVRIISKLNNLSESEWIRKLVTVPGN